MVIKGIPALFVAWVFQAPKPSSTHPERFRLHSVAYKVLLGMLFCCLIVVKAAPWPPLWLLEVEPLISYFSILVSVYRGF